MRSFRLIAAVLLVALGADLPRAYAFDWAGKLQRTLQDLRSPSAHVRRQAVEHLASYRVEHVRGQVLEMIDDPDPSVQRAAAKTATALKLRQAAPHLKTWLSSWDEDMRVAAARALAVLGNRGTVKTLVRVLNDPEKRVRLTVIAALGRLGFADAVVPLLARLEDSNAAVRRAAVDVLAGLGDRRAVLPLMGRLADTAREVRMAAVKALRVMADKRAAVAVTRLLNDPSAEVVDETIETLGALGYIGAVEPLIDLLQTGAARHREKVASALGRIAHPLAMRALVRALESPTQRDAAKRALVAAGPRAAQLVAALLKDPRTKRPVAIAAVQIARESRSKAMAPALLGQLRLGRLPRLLLIRTLGEIRDPRSQRPLLGLLGDPVHEVREAAMRALGPIIDARAAEPLLARLEDPVLRIRLIAIQYLGGLRARVATVPLLGMAAGKDLGVARAAAAAVAEIGDPRAAPALVKLLSHEDRLMRRIAVSGLATLRRPGNVAQVIARCKRTRASARVACIQAVGAVVRGQTDGAALAFLEQILAGVDHSLILAAIDALGAMRDPRIATVLIDRLPTMAPALRRAAVAVLGNQPRAAARAVPVLTRLLTDRDPRVAGAAGWALSKVVSRPAEAALVRAARSKGWSLRINATAALARLRSRSTIPLLRALAADGDPYVRANAILGLGTLGDRHSLELLVNRLQRDRSPWARLNALRALRRLAPASIRLPEGRRFDSADAVTRWLADSDPDPRVRAVITDLLRPATDKGRSWIGLYLLDGEHKPLRDGRFLLVTPGGLVKASYSDGRAQAWEEGLAPGRCFVERPTLELVPSGS